AKLGDFSPFAVLIFVLVVIFIIAVVVAVHGTMALRLAVPAWVTGGAEVVHRAGAEGVAGDDQIDDLRGAMCAGMSGKMRAGMSEGERVMARAARAARAAEVFGAGRRMTGMGAAGMTGVLRVMARETSVRPLMVTAMVLAARFACFIGRGMMLVMSSEMRLAMRAFTVRAASGLAIRPTFTFARGFTPFSALVRAGFVSSSTSPLALIAIARIPTTIRLVAVISCALGQQEIRCGVALARLFSLGNGPEEGPLPIAQSFGPGGRLIGPDPARVDQARYETS